MRTRRALLSLLPSVSLLLGGPVLAQDEAEDDFAGIDEIVVTITKRTESLQEVAGTVSVFGEELIREANIERMSDAVALIPNVQIKGGTNQSISIRGISQSFVSQSPVARHVNGVFKWDNESFTGHFYDLADIQVARGPSGVLYGRNATAGAIDLRWNKPHAGWEAFGDVTLANTDRYHFRGGVNVPLLGEGDERLMARFVFQREVHDGWVDNELTTRRDDPDRGDDTFLRLSLRSVLGESGEVNLRGFWNEREDGTISSTPVLDTFPVGALNIAGFGFFPTDAFDGYQIFRQAWLANPLLAAVTGVHSVLTGIPSIDAALQDQLVNGFGGLPPGCAPTSCVIPQIPGFFRDFGSFTPTRPVRTGDRQVRSNAHLLDQGKLEIHGIDGDVDWTFYDVPLLGDVRLFFVGGWEHFERHQVTDLDATESFILDVTNQWEEDLHSAELRLQSADAGLVEWTIGLFAFRRERNNVLDTVVDFVTPPSTSQVKETGIAPFANVTLRPIEALEIFLGGRWNRDRYLIDRSDPATSVQPLDLAIRATEKFRETTGEIGFKWFITGEHMLYGKYARGYKAGLLELDINAAIATQNVQFKNAAEPEIVDAFEAGVRTEWFDGRLTANFTVFYYDYTNLQVTQITGAQALTENAADATNQGAELELTIAPTPEWITQIAVGYLDATFDEFCSDDPFQFFGVSEPGCPQPLASGSITAGQGIDGKSNLAGKHLEDSPEWDITLISRYTFDLGEHGTLTPVVEFQWTDEYFSRPYNLPIDRIASRTKTDLRLIWRSPEETFSVELFVENLEDETVYGQRIIGAEHMGGWPVQVGTFPPRIYGVRLGFHWGERG